jgi:hypothetical protein
LYVHSRLISLNEVGGEPSRYGRSLTACIIFQVRADRHRRDVAADDATQTIGGCRSRIDALTEMPEWTDLVTRWMDYNRPWLEVDGECRTQTKSTFVSDADWRVAHGGSTINLAASLSAHSSVHEQVRCTKPKSIRAGSTES